MLGTTLRFFNGSLTRLSRRCITSRQLMYDKYGDPLKVLELKDVEIPGKVEANEVRIRWLAATINPADINQVQGTYPIKPQLPAVGGSEGFGEVEAVGSSVKEVEVGDWVVAAHSGLGCWRTRGVYKDEDVAKIDKNLSIEEAASFQVNPPTAYRMLKDFVDLKPGDLVVQNGANSAVGRAVIQIAHAKALRTVNVIRNRSNVNELIDELKSLGADEVFTEEEMKKEIRGKAKNARLALNCVGGKNALMLASCLANKGVMVTYGGMSKQPIQVPTGPFIFKDIQLVGFWMSRWYTYPENKPERENMFKELNELVRSGRFKTPHFQKVSLDDWKKAITDAVTSSDKKQLFVY
ncbi:unnamed protein product [Anisakis simplex]|uniref:Enoyl-[acyl-carrier-protein] reductase, mitochondrial n=1 Tax=Anisakis simplex TaxID=6269 RepID=A0A0M3JYC6_ANISI|nr:unnamed protein product [Anisakis simplex]